MLVQLLYLSHSTECAASSRSTDLPAALRMRHKSLCVVVACLVAVAAAASGPADGASTSGDSNKATTNTVHLNAAASRAAVRQPIRSSRQSGAHQQGAARREPLGNSTSADALHTHAASAMRMQPASSAGLHSSRHMVILRYVCAECPYPSACLSSDTLAVLLVASASIQACSNFEPLVFSSSMSYNLPSS